MIYIHTYSTDGYIRCVRSFFDSIKLFHRENIPLILTLRYVSDDVIDELKKDYNNIIFIKEDSNYEKDAKILNLSIDQFKTAKKKFECRDVVSKRFGILEHNLIYKQFISVNNRYRNSIKRATEQCDDNDLLVHFDSDTVIKDNITNMIDYMHDFDICIKLRLNKQDDSKKVLGSLISFKINEKSMSFLDRWRYYIDKIPLNERPFRYGQTSFYYAYRDTKNYISFGDLTEFDNLIEKTYRGSK